MNIEKIEKLLLLEINAERLDSTGLTNLIEETNRWFDCRKNSMEIKSPIEKIMSIILVSVNDMISREISRNDCPSIIDYPQEQIGEYQVDFLVKIFDNPDKKYVIECDGHDFHEKTKEQAKYDKQRERFLVANGYNVLRFSGSEIIGDFEKIKLELFSFFLKEVCGGQHD